jgi:hypothetical protein
MEAAMKVKYSAGTVGYLSFHEAQAALEAGTVEPINEADEQAKTGSKEDKAEIMGEGEPVSPAYETMTRAELDSLAKDRGVDVSGVRTKSEVIDVLRTAP